MRGAQAKRLRAAARIYTARVAVPITAPEVRISKRTPPVLFRMPSGELVPIPQPPKLITVWPAGSYRRAYQNIKRAYKRCAYTVQAAR